MENWRPNPIRGPVFLAISEENSSAIDQWKSLCPQARTIQLPGKHVDVLKPPSLEILLTEFANSVQHADVSEAQLSVPERFPGEEFRGPFTEPQKIGGWSNTKSH